MSDKTGWKGRGQQLRDSNWARRDRIPSPGSAKKNNYALEFPEGYIVLRGRELKTEIPVSIASIGKKAGLLRLGGIKK